MRSAKVTPPDDYHLSHSLRFLRGFSPQPIPATDESVLSFATPLSPDWTPTSLTVRQPASDLEIEWTGNPDSGLVVDHIRRTLSIDVDADGFCDVVDNDPVLRSIVSLDHGFRPPLFWSPYEAAVWAVLSQRVTMKQATNIKQRLAREHGHAPHFEQSSTPAPSKLVELKQFDELPDIKIERLRAVATAALDGQLDPAVLRSQPAETAAAALQTIAGIGPFSAELILVRGAGAPDVFPTNEKRLHDIMREQYEQPEAPLDELAEIAEQWSPYRSWVSFQLRAHSERGRCR